MNLASACGNESLGCGDVNSGCGKSNGCQNDCEQECCDFKQNSTCDGYSYCKTVFLPFSQAENQARRFAGVAHLQDLADEEDWNFHADFVVEYQQTFDNARLGSYFGANGSNRIFVGPDLGQTGSTFPTNIRNVDLGLSSTFAGWITIEPKIRNVIPDLAIYVGLDRWVEGMWFDLELPFAWTQWQMDICETDSNTGGNAFACDLTAELGPQFACIEQMDAITMAADLENDEDGTGAEGTVTDPDCIQVPVGSTTILQALSGTHTWGDHSAPGLLGARFLRGKFHKGGLADLPIQWGYNFWNRDCGFFGLFLRAVFPTGRINNNGSVFTPTIGYDRWQLGGGARGRVRFFESCDGDTRLDLYGNVYATYMFKRHECRVFDVRNLGCMSRYLLLEEADSAGNFTGNLVNFVDKFTACVESKINWNVDGLLFFDLQHCGWNWQVGWEIKARAREELSCDNVRLCRITACSSDRECEENCDDRCDGASVNDLLGGHQYGIKGSQCIPAIGEAVSSQLGTTINSISSPTPDSAAYLTTTLINETNFRSFLDFDRAAIPGAVANKVWSHLNYTWADRDYPIGAGLGFEVDFGNKNRQPRFWGIWGKVAVAYN